jgi:hypothetical protein
MNFNLFTITLIISVSLAKSAPIIELGYKPTNFLSALSDFIFALLISTQENQSYEQPQQEQHQYENINLNFAFMYKMARPILNYGMSMPKYNFQTGQINNHFRSESIYRPNLIQAKY